MNNQSDRNPTYTCEELARWILSTRTQPISDALLLASRRCLLDVIGCAAAGQDHPAVAAVKRTATSLFAAGRSTIWFEVDVSSSIASAFVNATAASILDIDDGSRSAMGHPGAAIVPAVVAMAQEAGASWEMALRAIVIGYEVAVRVGAAEVRPSFNSANYGCFGVAAAVGYLRGISQEEMAHALAICGSHGPRVCDLTLSSEMGRHVKEGIPWAVVNGFSAVMLAENGFTGCLDVLDISERFKPGSIRHDLGSEFAIQKIYFKRYSCCRWIHSSIEALMELLKDNQIVVQDIASIGVKTFGPAAKLNNSTNPQTLESAQYSIPYMLGVAAAIGEEALSPMRDFNLNNLAAVELAKKVTVSVSDEFDSRFPAFVASEVEVVGRFGCLRKRVDVPWGEASAPPTTDELIEKFERLTQDRLARIESAKIVEEIFESDTACTVGLQDLGTASISRDCRGLDGWLRHVAS